MLNAKLLLDSLDEMAASKAHTIFAIPPVPKVGGLNGSQFSTMKMQQSYLDKLVFAVAYL